MKIQYLIFIFLLGCSTSKCRQLTSDPQEEAKKTTLFVYKYDGSLQCGMGKEVPVEKMEQELKGIKVLSKTKKPDNLMRVQVCGSNTGQANVYEIPLDKLPEAEKKGFKEWTYEK